MRFLYTILFYFALPFILLRLLWRSRRLPAYRKRWAERFGFCPHHLEKSIWVHAVSVGEVIAAIPLIKRLKKAYPDLPLLVTTTTPTGAERVKESFGDTVLQSYIPYDVPFLLTRFLQSIHPKILIVMETELWPNLFAVCHKHHIPIVVANARLSQKSAKGYGAIWMAPIRREMFAAINHLAAQSHLDAERFHQLGLNKKKIMITGNLKFDLELPADLLAKSAVLHDWLGKNHFIWIAASTHPGEEEIILHAAQIIRKKNPSALLILVPRHPDRFDTVAALVQEKGFKIARRSLGDTCPGETAVYLADTMGELLLLYSVAAVAFVGGSLIQVGGHNMLEPAALHKPIITGPILFNFAEISQLLLDANGMVIAKNANEIAECVLRFFADPSDSRITGDHAYQVVARNRGALEKQLRLIEASLKSIG